MPKMKVGIVGTSLYGVFGTREEYWNLAKQMGTPVLINPEDGLQPVNILILPGGADVDFHRYTKIKHFWAGEPDENLETFDSRFLEEYVGRIPILGICRGMQTLNVFFGGSLYQHLWTHPYSKDNKDLVHRIYHSRGGFLQNSFHHQALKRVASNFTVLARAEDNTVEAVVDEKQNIFAVQYHPERFMDEWTARCIRQFIMGR